MKLFQSTIERSLYLLLLLVFLSATAITVYLYSGVKHNQETLKNNCLVGNDFRKTEKDLWLYILSFPPSQTPTEEQKTRVVQFKAYLDKAFAQRDCTKL